MTTSDGSAAAPQAHGHQRFRPDIEGLRALAVALVVADHLLGFPAGGYVGVDVFFVISGFLITGLLVREREREGRISFADFYRRRARRILPVAVLVLTVTTVAAYAVFLGGRGATTLVDALWALPFAANWHYAQLGTDYFQTAAPPSALQHYWSLAVEEQFYVVWPWLILLAYQWASRAAGRRPRRRVLAVLAAAAALSLVWSVVQTSSSPTTAYFSTFTRAWELGAGALVAAGAVAARRIPGAARPVLAYVGLGLILGSAVLMGPSTAFPGVAAAVPVAGAVIFIVAGTGTLTAPAWWWPLTDPVSRYVGKISYSVYLWHWPVIVVFVAGVLPTATSRTDKLVNAGAGLLLALTLSVLSFHLVEDPIRRSSWLEPRSRRADTRRRRSLRPPGRIAVAGCAVLAASLVVGAVAMPSGAVAPPNAGEGGSGRQAEVAAGLRQTSWGTTTPALEDLADSGAPILQDAHCINGRTDVDHWCRYGTGSAGRAVLLGDSVAMSWMPGLEAALEARSWTLDVYGKFGCGFAEVTQTDKDGTAYTSCDEHHAWALAQIEADPPDLVVVSESWAVVAAGSGDAEGRWADGVESTLRRLVAMGVEVVVLEAPPYGTSVQACATRVHTPQECAFAVPGSVDRRGAVYRSATAATGARWVPTLDWFCVGGWCPPVVDGIVVRSDSVHLTEAESTALADELADALDLGPASTQ